MNSIPSGWEIKPLGEVATLQRGFDLPVQARIPGNVPVFAANGPVGTHNVAKIVGPGVVTGRSGTLGEVHFIESDYWPLNTALWVKDFHGNDPKWVARLLKWMRLETHTRGTGVPTLNRNLVHVVPVLVPPLAEQRRIADILDRAEAVRRKRQEAIALTEELLRSAFLEMFGDPVTNSKGWETDLFGSVGILDRGKSKHRPRNDPTLLGGKYPLIQTGDVARSNGWIKEYTQTYSEKGLAQSKLWKAGTLCITIAANIAQTGILTFDACFPDSVVGFTPSHRVTSEYIQEWLSFLQPILEDKAPQSAQKNINLQILRGLDLPIPPINLQQIFSEFVQQVRSSYSKFEGDLYMMDRLFNSILYRAFQGEL